MRVSFSRLSTTEPGTGTAPPLKLVPPPRGTTGARAARQTRRMAATWAASAGKTTTAGIWVNPAVASRE